MQPNIYGFLDLIRLVYKPEEAVPLKETFSALLELNEHVHIRAFNKHSSKPIYSLPCEYAKEASLRNNIAVDDRSSYKYKQVGAVSTQSRPRAKKERWNAGTLTRGPPPPNFGTRV
jgi:hypothetical protein